VKLSKLHKQAGTDFDDFQEQSTIGLDMRNVVPNTRKTINFKPSDAVLLLLLVGTYVPVIICGNVGKAFSIMLFVIAGVTLITLAVMIIRYSTWVWWSCTLTWLTGTEIATAALTNSHSAPLALSIPILFLVCPISIALLTWRKFRGWEPMLKIVGMVIVINLAIFVGVKYIFP
jgi:hypothetical protein